MSSKTLNNPICWLVIFTLIFGTVVFGLYFYNFPGEFSKNPSYWGSFGSFVGGTIGSVFASLSFLALLYTVYIQRTELNLAIISFDESAKGNQEQVVNIKIQKFESSFYSLLDLHNNALKDLMSSKSDYKNILDRVDEKYISLPLDFLKIKQKLILKDEALSQYFRILYQLLKFVAKYNIKNTEKIFNSALLSDRKTININENEEKMYVSIIRGFIPINLLPVLSLNCIPSPGCVDNLELYWGMLERYKFLEHIKLESINVESAFLILDRYSFSLGNNAYFDNKFNDLKIANLNLCYPDLTEGGYLHVRCKAGA